MNGWFWSRALGPGPSEAMGVTRVKGFPGQVMTAKKKVEIEASVAPGRANRWWFTRSKCSPMMKSPESGIRW